MTNTTAPIAHVVTFRTKSEPTRIHREIVEGAQDCDHAVILFQDSIFTKVDVLSCHALTTGLEHQPVADELTWVEVPAANRAPYIAEAYSQLGFFGEGQVSISRDQDSDEYRINGVPGSLQAPTLEQAKADAQAAYDQAVIVQVVELREHGYGYATVLGDFLVDTLADSNGISKDAVRDVLLSGGVLRITGTYLRPSGAYEETIKLVRLLRAPLAPKGDQEAALAEQARIDRGIEEALIGTSLVRYGTLEERDEALAARAADLGTLREAEQRLLAPVDINAPVTQEELAGLGLTIRRTQLKGGLEHHEDEPLTLELLEAITAWNGCLDGRDALGRTGTRRCLENLKDGWTIHTSFSTWAVVPQEQPKDPWDGLQVIERDHEYDLDVPEEELPTRTIPLTREILVDCAGFAGHRMALVTLDALKAGRRVYNRGGQLSYVLAPQEGSGKPQEREEVACATQVTQEELEGLTIVVRGALGGSNTPRPLTVDELHYAAILDGTTPRAALEKLKAGQVIEGHCTYHYLVEGPQGRLAA